MRIRTMLACTLCALTMCGCDEDVGSSSVPEEKPPVQTTAAQTQPVEVREYSFPEFVRSKAAGDMLANVINVGFDPAEAESYLETDPFKDYNCDCCLGGEYYTFYEDDYVGILNSEGTVILNPDKYASAKMVSRDLIVLSYPEGNNKKDSDSYFEVNGGFGRFISRDEALQLDVAAMAVEETAAVQYSLAVRGTSDPAVYDSIEELDPSRIVTEKKFSHIYKAVLGSRVYYLVLDEYLNITVCEAPYAQISFKIGGEYGNCYVLDGDDHNELLKMIQSFGSETMSVKPSKDEALDYIRIESGLNIGDKRVFTMSPDGFCLTEMTSSEGSTNRFFTLYPKDAFVDLVNWVGEVAGREYTSGVSEDSASEPSDNG